MSGDERARVIAEVLAAHIATAERREVGWLIKCGHIDGSGGCDWTAIAGGPSVYQPEIGEQHRAHLGAVVALADAPEACPHVELPDTLWARLRSAEAAVAAALPTPAPEAPAGEDATLTTERLAELLRLHEAAGTGFAAIQRRELLAVLALAQRGAADQATLAAVRALAEEQQIAAQEFEFSDSDWERLKTCNCAHCEGDDGICPMTVSAMIGDRLDEAWDSLLALLDGPDAGGGRRE